MIIVNMCGRLGNQLFEYAAARKLQSIYNEKIILNSYDLVNYAKLEFMLGDFTLNDSVQIVDNEHLPWFSNLRCIPTRVIRKAMPTLYFDLLSPKGVFMWYSEQYRKLPLVSSENKIMNGWFQSDRYFPEIKDILIKELVPKKPLLTQNTQMYHHIQTNASVCVSIRRGDYVENAKIKKRYFVCGHNYFYTAIKLLKQKVPDCMFVVFSDDIQWVRANMNFPNNTIYESGTDPVWEKLRLMSACKHFIISNSSFSWWAQYLSTNDNKVVIAPNRWYAKGVKTDIYQSNWIVLNPEDKRGDN